MLDTVNLDCKLDKEDFAGRNQELKDSLYSLQQKIREASIPVIILFEGWGASGKGSRIADLIANWDPRGYKVYSIIARDEAERRLPPMARYWQKIPEQGQIAVFDRSWYRDIHTEFIDDGIAKNEWQERIRDINTFERQLSDNGYIILKFFLHISKQEQKERFEELRAHKNTAWRVTRADFKHHNMYDEYYKVFSKVIEKTEQPYAPWNLISATDKRYATISIFQAVVSHLEAAVLHKENNKEAPAKQALLVQKENNDIFCNFHLLKPPSLDDVPLSQCVSEEVYEKKLEHLQKKLSNLHNCLYRKKIPVIITYEGWDGAGKGGSIKRISRSLDPRGYEVIPIAAPAPYEKSRHYLWRFWNVIPKTGHVVIFDRTWYGRCLVERIEGYCSKADWKRSYTEINEFENYLHRQGYIIIKFWFQIDKDEQLRRFEEREKTPEKRWKITEEDWRNREKWDLYKEAAQDIFAQTSTDFAPWIIIEGNSKYFARIKALETVIAGIEKRLK